jgi:hypothetical protein
MSMKKGLFSMVFASAVLSMASMASAGSYGPQQEAEEIPAPPPAPVVEEETMERRVVREFAGFMTDGETSNGLWAEIGSVYGAEYDVPGGDVDAVRTYAHISYGQERFEVGVLVPYLYVDQENFGDDNGFGDLSVWGKFMFVRTEKLSVGAGLVAEFPTGKDAFSYDEYGFEPFLTAGFWAGPAALRAMVGYHVTTEPNELFVADDAFDYVDVNGGVLYPIGENVVVRAEVIYQHWTDSKIDPVSLVPGADIIFPMGDMELLLRPTVGVGFNDEAPDWQAGLGIAVHGIGG